MVFILLQDIICFIHIDPQKNLENLSLQYGSERNFILPYSR